MRIPLKAAALLEPLFHCGSNLGTKLSPQARTGMALSFDTELAAVVVEYQGNVSLVFSANLNSATPTDPRAFGPDLSEHRPNGTVRHDPAPQPVLVTAPAPVARAMAPQVHIPNRQVQSAQVSHPVHDAVNGIKMTSPPKYLPHTQRELQRSAQVNAAQDFTPGRAAPTTAELQATGKLPGAPEASAPAPRARRSRAAKVEGN